MSAMLDLLNRSLDLSPSPVIFFLRDDDAGWGDQSLYALLEVTHQCAVPIDLAVIPMDVSASLAHELRTRRERTPDLLGLHQHGWSHLNHEQSGRKCEFGPTRPVQLQRADLLNGRHALSECFGDLLDPFFTPPWNRCGPQTPALLARMGYQLLSRSQSASPQADLPEVSVSVDWCKQSALAVRSGDSQELTLTRAIDEAIRAGGPVGVMLHHAQMDSGDLFLLDALLRAIAHHPRAHWLPMRAVASVLLSGPSSAAWLESGDAA